MDKKGTIEEREPPKRTLEEVVKKGK